MKKLSVYWQLFLWYFGIAWHNSIRNECTPDFNCCAHCGRKKWLMIPDRATFAKDKGGMSDGYHSFNELYEHRITLYIKLCQMIQLVDDKYNLRSVWMSKTHSDGEIWDGWFILGINEKKGMQITYHLPISRWNECLHFAEIKDKAPDYDGHTSEDVLKRIKQL